MALTPSLMFTGDAEAAVRFYVTTFPDAEILDLDLVASDAPGGPDTVGGARFRIADLTIRCFDSPPVHDFGFTPSVSFAFDCDSDAELDRLFARLSEGGSVLMPPGEYPFARRFTWVTDRFGVSWQLSVADR